MCRRRPSGHVPSHFAEQREDHQHQPGNLRQVHAEQLVGFRPQIETCVRWRFSFCVCAVFFFRSGGNGLSADPRVAGTQPALLDLRIASSDLLLIMLVDLPRLLQREQMLGPPVAFQRFPDRFFAGFNTWIPQFRQRHRVALPARMASTIASPVNPGDIVDHVMDLHIHLRQRFVHMLDMLAGHLHQIVAVPHQRPHCAYLAFRPECRSQQSHRMQKLQPLAFVPVGAPPRHIFHAPGVHQTRLHPVLLQHIVERNPVHPGGFHRHRGDATTHQPLGHSSRSSVKVANTRTGFSSRSGGTATKISLAPISIPAALAPESGDLPGTSLSVFRPVCLGPPRASSRLGFLRMLLSWTCLFSFRLR